MRKNTDNTDTPRNFAIWDPEYSITKPDIVLAAKNGTLKQ